MAKFIKVKNSYNCNDNVLINLDKVILIQPYGNGTKFYFSEKYVLCVFEPYEKVNEIIQGITNKGIENE